MLRAHTHRMVPRPDDPLPVIPDDASELEPDRLRWVAEERAKRRRAWFQRLMPTRWTRAGIPVPLLAAALTCTCALAALALMLTPRAARGPGPVPLANVPPVQVPATDESATAPRTETVGLPATWVPATAGAGTTGHSSTPVPGPSGPIVRALPMSVVGRRLPSTTLSTAAGPEDATDLRPAVVALLPSGCRCAATLGALRRQAQEFRLRLWLLGSGADTAQRRAELAGQARAGTGGTAGWALDGTAKLGRAMRARGLTLALIQADGVIRQVRRDLPADGNLPALESQLVLLDGNGRP